MRMAPIRCRQGMNEFDDESGMQGRPRSADLFKLAEDSDFPGERDAFRPYPAFERVRPIHRGCTRCTAGPPAGRRVGSRDSACSETYPGAVPYPPSLSRGP